MHGTLPIDEAWTLLYIAKHAELEIAEQVERTGDTDAEIVPGTQAQWYLVHCVPGQDARAMRWLSRRRFGVFRPMQQRIDRKRGVAVQGWEPVFPGWVFVLCWMSQPIYHRIKACPGVLDVLKDPATMHPVPIEENFVDRLRALAWVYNEAAPRQAALRSRSAVSGNRHIKRTLRRLAPKDRKELQRLKQEIKARELFDDNEWHQANLLDPFQRIALLRRTLQIASDVGCRATAAA